MNRTDLVVALSRRTGHDAATVSSVLDGLADVLRECASAGTRVQLSGLLTMERVERAARAGRNPRTGQPIEIPAQHSVRITPSAALKAAAKGER